MENQNNNNGGFTYKQQQQLIKDIFIPLIQAELAKNKQDIHHFGKVTAVYSNSKFADVMITPDQKQPLHLNNKSNVLLKIGDMVRLVAPNGNMTNSYIEASCNSDQSLVGANIVGQLDGENITFKNLKDLVLEQLTVTTEQVDTIYGGNINVTRNGIECPVETNLSNTITWTGQGSATANTITTINLPTAFTDIYNGSNYIVKFYPYSSCQYSIIRHNECFEVATNANIEFGFDVTAILL